MPSKKKAKQSKSSLNSKTKQFKKVFAKKITKKHIGFVVILVIIAAAYLLRSLFFVAFVNGSPITRIEFTKDLEKNIGKETLDNLITKKLILQEANKKGVIVSNEDVDKEIENISSMIESQGSSLDQVLASQDRIKDDLEENIRIQKTVERILEDKVKVTEDELIDYFEKNSELYGKDANFTELKETISQQLKQEKLSNEYETWLNNLKTESKIIYFLNF